MSEWDKTLTLNAEGIINIHSDLDSVKSDQNKYVCFNIHTCIFSTVVCTDWNIFLALNVLGKI